VSALREPYGVIGAYREPEPLVAAARRLRAAGICDLDAFTPFPVPELDEVLDARAGALPWLVLAGGILGALAAYGLVLYSVGVDYPINVGGRPLNAWPAYLVLAFEGGVLGSALAGFVGMLALSGLPLYYHPVFNAPHFTFAREDRFYLLVRRSDVHFAEAGELLRRSGAMVVEEVPP
jgi:hypothetical protein